MKSKSQKNILHNYIQSEFSRMKSNSILFSGIFILTVLVIVIKIISLFFYSHQLVNQYGVWVPFTERLPAYLSLIQSNFDMWGTNLMYGVYLIIFPIVNAIVYSSSICLEKESGISKMISVKLPLHQYFLGKVIVSAVISLSIFIFIYSLDVILSMILFPINGTEYFHSIGDIFSNEIIVITTGSHSANQPLYCLGIMVVNAIAFMLYSIITCCLAFITKLKYPAVLLSTMLIGFFVIILFDNLQGINLQNFALGRLTCYYLNSPKGVSILVGLLSNVLAVSALTFYTYRRLKRIGDVY